MCLELGYSHHVHSILVELLLGFLGIFLIMPLFFGLKFFLCRQDLCNVNARLKETEKIICGVYIHFCGKMSGIE